MKYNVLKMHGARHVEIVGTRLCGFDTGHPSLLIDFSITGYGQGTYSDYIPLDNPDMAATKLASLLGEPSDAERPLTSYLNELERLEGKRFTLYCVNGKKANGARFDRLVWQTTPKQAACAAAAATLGVDADALSEILGRYGIN